MKNNLRFGIGLVCLNEASWLRLHLPVMLQLPLIDGLFAIDGGSTDDSVAVIQSFGGQVECHEWRWDFAEQQNWLVSFGERLGYDAMMKYDPDELMFPEHISQCVSLLARGHKALVVSRYNFELDRHHYSPYLYPDKQLRFHVLNEGFYWYRRLHATTNAYELWKEPAGTSIGVERPILWLPHVNIYHYEGLRPMSERCLKWHNYMLVAEGKAPVEELPPDVPVPDEVRFSVVFRGPQPLECHAKAPYHISLVQD